MYSKYAQDIQVLYSDENTLYSIFIGNIEAAQNLNTLKDHSIGAVITVANGAFLEHSKDELPNYLYLAVDDHQSFNLLPYFNKTYEFIQKNIQRTNVLVHCMAGISRSATIIIAYLMRKFKRSANQIYLQMKTKRKIINPNSGFKKQLISYENTFFIQGTGNKNPIKKSYENDQSPLQTRKQSFTFPNKLTSKLKTQETIYDPQQPYSKKQSPLKLANRQLSKSPTKKLNYDKKLFAITKFDKPVKRDEQSQNNILKFYINPQKNFT